MNKNTANLIKDLEVMQFKMNAMSNTGSKQYELNTLAIQELEKVSLDVDM